MNSQDMIGLDCWGKYSMVLHTCGGNSHTMSYALICCLLLGLEEWTSHIRRGKKSEQGINKLLRISLLYQHVVRLS